MTQTAGLFPKILEIQAVAVQVHAAMVLFGVTNQPGRSRSCEPQPSSSPDGLNEKPSIAQQLATAPALETTRSEQYRSVQLLELFASFGNTKQSEPAHRTRGRFFDRLAERK